MFRNVCNPKENRKKWRVGDEGVTLSRSENDDNKKSRKCKLCRSTGAVLSKIVLDPKVDSKRKIVNGSE